MMLQAPGYASSAPLPHPFGIPPTTPQNTPPQPTAAAATPRKGTMTVPFTQVPNEVLRTNNLTRNARLLYGVLLSYRSRNSGQCNPSITMLARDMSEPEHPASERSVKRWLDELLGAGMISHRHDYTTRAPWLYDFPSLQGDTHVTLNPCEGDTHVTLNSSEGDTHVTPNVQGDTERTFRVTPVSSLYKEEPYALEQEDTNARADGVLDHSVPQDLPDVLWRVLGMRQENNNNRARMMQLWPLLAEPLKRLRLDVGDRGQHKEIRALASNLEQLRRSVEVPLADLVRWQHWELGDPYWDQPDAVTYNPVRRHERSWGRWKRQGSPEVYATTPSARPGQGYGSSGRLNHEGRDPTLIGSGNVRWAHSPTEEEDTNVYDAEHPRKILRSVTQGFS